MCAFYVALASAAFGIGDFAVYCPIPLRMQVNKRASLSPQPSHSFSSSGKEFQNSSYITQVDTLRDSGINVGFHVILHVNNIRTKY